LIEAIKLLPEDVMLQRVSAGIEDDTLLSPAWCYTKHQQMFNIREALKKEGLAY
jgi:radical SAM superfamily enzyme